MKFAWLPVLAVSMTAAPLNLNTGTAAWQVTQTVAGAAGANGPALNVSGAAVVLTGTLPFAANLPGFEQFAWANPFGGAVWVGQLATDGQFTNGSTITCGTPCGATSGDYIYTLTFAGGFGGSFNLSGFTGDNGVRALSVTASNGSLYSCTVGGPGTLCAGTQNAVTASTGTLNYGAGGTVTITARIENLGANGVPLAGGRNASGFILAGSGTSNDAPAVPEPSTYAMLGLGGLALAVARLRRK